MMVHSLLITFMFPSSRVYVSIPSVHIYISIICHQSPNSTPVLCWDIEGSVVSRNISNQSEIMLCWPSQRWNFVHLDLPGTCILYKLLFSFSFFSFAFAWERVASGKKDTVTWPGPRCSSVSLTRGNISQSPNCISGQCCQYQVLTSCATIKGKHAMRGAMRSASYDTWRYQESQEERFVLSCYKFGAIRGIKAVLPWKLNAFWIYILNLSFPESIH